MTNYYGSNASAYRAGQIQWAPTLTAHDPNPPIPLEDLCGTLSRTLTALTVDGDVGLSGAGLVASVQKTGSLSGGTSSAVDTTGATLLVIHTSQWVGSTEALPSDSKGNSWTGLTVRSGPTDPRSRIFYATNPVVGSGHTFTISGTNVADTSVMAAFIGVTAFDVENGAGPAGTGTSVQTGSVTPSANGELIFAGLSVGNAETGGIGIDSGFTLLHSANYASGVNEGGGVGYLIQGTAAAVNPTWSWTGTATRAATIATFKDTSEVQGSLSKTLGALLSVANVSVDLDGTLSKTLASLTVDGDVAIDIDATLAGTLGAVTLAGDAEQFGGGIDCLLEQELTALVCSSALFKWDRQDAAAAAWAAQAGAAGAWTPQSGTAAGWSNQSDSGGTWTPQGESPASWNEQ